MWKPFFQHWYVNTMNIWFSVIYECCFINPHWLISLNCMIIYSLKCCCFWTKRRHSAHPALYKPLLPACSFSRTNWAGRNCAFSNRCRYVGQILMISPDYCPSRYILLSDVQLELALYWKPSHTAVWTVKVCSSGCAKPCGVMWSHTLNGVGHQNATF